MDRRTLLALALTALVIVLTPIVFRMGGRRAATPAAVATDTGTRASQLPATATAAPAPAPAATVPVPAPTGAPVPPTARSRAETTTVTFDSAQYTFSTLGGAPEAVRLTAFSSLRPDVPRKTSAMLTANPGGAAAGVSPLLRYRLVLGADTISLDTIPFRVERGADGVTFTSTSTPAVTLRYEFAPKGYIAHVSGQMAPAGAAGGTGQLLIALPTTLRSQDADTLDDERHLAYGYKLEHADVKTVAFGKLDPALVRTDSGPMTWVAARNKYFLIALVAPQPASSFTALRMQGGARVGKTAPTARATAIAPIRDGRFAFDLYAGPQSWTDLRAVGHDLENVNPYGGWIPGVQPFATICMRVLLWMKKTFNLSYGWVLIIFGVAVRLLLWPLNQTAMRSSLKMQRLQPELAEVQKRYKNEPEKQREALVKLYQQHGMSPFSPVMGCLPMLLPMPVLFALFYVFQNTIEFRGVPFLWLPDLSLRDPYYIMPIVMGVSMFVLSWIGMRAAPPNPQTKMMSYMMPAVMTMVLLNFASGLNLYYAVQNVAALPQQLLLTRERMKAAPAAAPAPPLRGRRATT
jgi:YidC/Oxa1 family membrane protein insertase